MQGTFKLPSGRKIRSQSQRRYVLVSDGTASILGIRGRPYIVRRSDNVDTLRKVRSSRRPGDGKYFPDQVILDTVQGRVVS